MCLKYSRGVEAFSKPAAPPLHGRKNMKRARNLLAMGVPARFREATFGFAGAIRILILLGVLLVTGGAASPLHAQPARSLSLPPSISVVGTNDKACQDGVSELRRLIHEFAFVRGHRIFLVCDANSWNHVMHHLTLEYGVIVNSRGAISDIHLRETWFYNEALLKGVDGHNGEFVYAHELGHFLCSCIDEAAADKAAVQLLDDARHNRFNNGAATMAASK
jgi:hypothetical protein